MPNLKIPALLRRLLVCGAPLLLAACAGNGGKVEGVNRLSLDPGRTALALAEVQQKQDRGLRVWCVPFARTASGIDIRGNAKTWWGKAKGEYARGSDPQIGSVMTFQATRGMPLGHVAVVSDVVSPREILVDHANWHRNEVSLGMAVIDVSKGNDWSAVRLESQLERFGRVYPVNGFIYPHAQY